MNDPRKLAFYVRVSTISQDYPSQLHALNEFCRRSGWAVPPKNRIFSEKSTGKIARRTQLDLLLQACRDGHVDAILTYAVDRLGNSALHMHRLFEQLEALKIRVVGATDTIDTAVNNAATNLMRNMVIAWSQAGRERIAERTVAGLNAARAAGRLGGRPQAKANQKKIARAIKLRATWKGSLRGLAKHVGLDAGYLWNIFKGKKGKPKP